MTIRDIAKKTGYSVSTVSRALNNHPEIAQETKEKIQKMIEECNFIPNGNAKRLKVQTTNRICILITGASNMFLEAILQRVHAQIMEKGYTAESYYVNEQENVVQLARQIEVEQKPVAIVFLGGSIEHFERHFHKITTPSVLVASCSKELCFQNLSMVGIDDYESGKSAAEYLLNAGHQNIAVVGGRRCYSTISKNRWDGFCKQCHEKAVTSYYETSFTFAGGYEAMQEILKQKIIPSAVFCLSDSIAMGAMRAAHEHGLSIPNDISFLGFDAIPLVNYCIPSLSTIEQPQQQLADIGISLLFRLLKDKTDSECIIIQTSLLKKESVLERNKIH